MATDRSPWIFKRDEFDVLEEAYAEVFDVHEQTVDPERHTLEEMILQEHLDTEDASERDVLSELGGLAPAAEHEHPSLLEERSLADLLRREGGRDPLYAEAYAFAQRVSVWAKAFHQQQEDFSKDAFRILANVYLIPMKVSFAMTEVRQRDQHSQTVMKKESDLALVYLGRVAESLQRLEQQEISVPDHFLEAATRLIQQIKKAQADFLKPRPFSL